MSTGYRPAFESVRGFSLRGPTEVSPVCDDLLPSPSFYRLLVLMVPVKDKVHCKRINFLLYSSPVSSTIYSIEITSFDAHSPTLSLLHEIRLSTLNMRADLVKTATCLTSISMADTVCQSPKPNTCATFSCESFYSSRNTLLRLQ